MGRYHADGYSADVEGYLVVDGQRIVLGKTNSRQLFLAEPCELPPGTEGELLIIIDGNASSRLVTLPSGVVQGQIAVEYTVAAPF